MEPKTPLDTTQQSEKSDRERQDQWRQDKESLLAFFNLQVPPEVKEVPSSGTDAFESLGNLQGPPGDSSSLEDLMNMVSGGTFWDEISIMEREVTTSFLFLRPTQ